MTSAEKLLKERINRAQDKLAAMLAEAKSEKMAARQAYINSIHDEDSVIIARVGRAVRAEARCEAVELLADIDSELTEALEKLHQDVGTPNFGTIDCRFAQLQSLLVKLCKEHVLTQARHVRHNSDSIELYFHEAVVDYLDYERGFTYTTVRDILRKAHKGGR